MEYIKKEDLKEGEIYNCLSPEGNKYIIKLTRNFKNCININKGVSTLYRDGYFHGDTLKFSQATFEEKHWLNECIKLDKFITFEEAVKTFIPEYVEVLSGFFVEKEEIGKIYKTSDNFPNHLKHCKNFNWNTLLKNESYKQSFKPSTKEAYDAQFVVKEPEFVLPEKWCIKINENNQEIIKQFLNNCGCGFYINQYIYFLNKISNQFKRFQNYTWNMYSPDKIPVYLYYKDCKDSLEITFEQFKKYVLKEEIDKEIIKPLPQFKIIETIETITKVENNEGNQFFIGDKVKTLTNNIYIITGFKYNENKTNILAIFDNKNSFIIVGIDKIEHYIEPKIVEPEFILPEKWCVLRNEENHKILNKWCNKNHLIEERYSYTDNTKKLIYSEKPNNSWNKYKRFCDIIDNTFTEITFDQFQKYVLKTEVKEELLLEKAKRLYPIGTKFNNYKIAKGADRTVEVLTTNIVEEFGKIKLINPEKPVNDNAGTWTLYKDSEFAEIIE